MVGRWKMQGLLVPKWSKILLILRYTSNKNTQITLIIKEQVLYNMLQADWMFLGMVPANLFKDVLRILKVYIRVKNTIALFGSSILRQNRPKHGEVGLPEDAGVAPSGEGWRSWLLIQPNSNGLQPSSFSLLVAGKTHSIEHQTRAPHGIMSRFGLGVRLTLLPPVHRCDGGAGAAVQRQQSGG